MLLERDDEVLIDYCKNNENLIRKIEDASNALKRYNDFVLLDYHLGNIMSEDSNGNKAQNNEKEYLNTPEIDKDESMSGGNRENEYEMKIHESEIDKGEFDSNIELLNENINQNNSNNYVHCFRNSVFDKETYMKSKDFIEQCFGLCLKYIEDHQSSENPKKYLSFSCFSLLEQSKRINKKFTSR